MLWRVLRGVGISFYPPVPPAHLFLPRMGGKRANPAPGVLSRMNKRKGMRQVCLSVPAYPSSLGETLTHLPVGLFGGGGRGEKPKSPLRRQD